MKIRVRLFAIIKERAGFGEVELELPEGAKLGEVASALKQRCPAVADFLGRSAYAINREYANAATRLSDGDEVAVIPPVSGGSPR